MVGLFLFFLLVLVSPGCLSLDPGFILDGSGPFGDSSHCGNEGKFPGTADDLQVNNFTSSVTDPPAH